MSGFDVINQTVNNGTSGTPGAIITGAAYTVTLNDSIIEYNPTAQAQTITFPAASAALGGKVWLLAQTASTTNQATIKTAGGTINGVAAATGVAQTASKIGLGLVFCDGTNYFMELI